MCELPRPEYCARRRSRPPIEPYSILTSQTPEADDDPALPDPDTVEATFLKLLYDAATVRSHALEHPISVARQGSGWVIESGERRTLVRWVDDDQYNRIPAVEVSERSVR